MQNLVEINAKELDVVFDLRYASANNVCGHQLYAKPFCFLHKDAVIALKKAAHLAKNLDLRLKIFDSFRPLEVQKYMFDKFSADGDSGFISNPEGGVIPHCRGVAVDLTLTDKAGNELDMGTDFDEFSDLAFHACDKIPTEAQKNRFILLGIMSAAGWDFYSKEWWHYQLFNPRQYEIIKTEDGMIHNSVTKNVR